MAFFQWVIKLWGKIWAIPINQGGEEIGKRPGLMKHSRKWLPGCWVIIGRMESLSRHVSIVILLADCPKFNIHAFKESGYFYFNVYFKTLTSFYQFFQRKLIFFYKFFILDGSGTSPKRLMRINIGILERIGE